MAHSVIWIRLTSVQASCTQGNTRGGQPAWLGMAVVSLIFVLPASLLCLGMCKREKILNPMAGLSQQHLSQQISLSFSSHMESYSICQGTCHWYSLMLTQALMVPCLQKIHLLPHLGCHIVHALNVQVRNERNMNRAPNTMEIQTKKNFQLRCNWACSSSSL